MNLNSLNDSVQFLAANNCRRDTSCGQWLNPDGLALGSDPVTAAKSLRHHIIKAAVENQQKSGKRFTR